MNNHISELEKLMTITPKLALSREFSQDLKTKLFLLARSFNISCEDKEDEIYSILKLSTDYVEKEAALITHVRKLIQIAYSKGLKEGTKINEKS